MKKVLAGFGLLLVAALAGWAGEDPHAKAVALVDRATGIKKFSQQMEMSMDMMGQTMTVSGKMWADGDKMRIEMKNPAANMDQIVISDGSTTWSYSPAMKMAQRMDLKKVRAALGTEAPGIGGVSTDSNPFKDIDRDTVQYVGEEKIGEETVDVIEGGVAINEKAMAGMANMMPQKARFWLSRASGMPLKSVYYNKAGKTMMSQSVSGVVVNPEIDAALFVFEKPEDAQVMDMTEMIINLTRQAEAPPAGALEAPEDVLVAPTAIPPADEE